VLLPLVGGAGILAAAASDAETTRDWIALAAAASAGAAAILGYTLALARRNRLFLREPEAIERSRSTIKRLAIPLGWVGGLAFIAVGLAVGGSIHVAMLGLLGGLALGIFPGAFANFLRLRREEWNRR
jgi:membrane associated rhomboid family serine protease